MCGRYTLRASASEITEFFGLMRDLIEWDRPRFNIAPTQSVLAVRAGSDGREPVRLRWGLIPSWAKDTKLAATMINARAETVAEKPAYRAAFKRRRCLVPVSGFYEWRRDGKPFTLWNLVDALTHFNVNLRYAGDRIEADQKVAKLMELAV